MTRTVTLSLVITSCGGTFSVIVRRSIRTIWSMNGISRIRPGPFWAISRPSRKMTPRSYSRRILIAAARMIRMKTARTAITAMATVT